MLHNRLTIPIIVLLAGVIAWSIWAQKRPQDAYAAAAAVPTPGQPAAPTVPTPVPVPGVAQPPAAVRPPTAPAPGAPTQKPEEQMRIVADPATNSLVIYGTVQEFQNIKTILKDLDIVPRQVLLDVLIVEVTLMNTETFGIEYEIFSKQNPSIFGQQFGSAGAIRDGILPPAASSGFSQFGNGISGIIGRSNAIQAFITALATDNRLKVLSSPSILAADNRPARIQVGSQQPIATGSVSTPITTAAGTGTGTSFATSATIQYQNTGRIVTIIPQVNSFGLVNLQILAEVSQINTTPAGSVQLGTSGTFPSFDIRQAETTAVVQDGDTLAIGGIIADNRIRNRTGVPYLMDIPVVGRFFGTTKDDITRTELVMLITPHVIRNREQGQQITEDFKKSLSAVRSELDRMARERERLQQIPMQKSPALPGPSGGPVPPMNPIAPPPSAAPVPPVPAPSSAPAAPQKPVAPLRQINSPSPVVPGLPQPPAVLAPAEVPRESEKMSSAQPAYALSLTRQLQPARPAAPAVAKSQPIVPSNPKRQWAVQVAALATSKDAQTMADFLRKAGYDSYVMIFENQGKTWHRVRIGRFVDLQSAMQLKNSLADSAQFKQAYVAAN